MRISLGEKGDTIIEVLIAVGIVSLIVTSAYATTNRNVQASQNIQEQGQAQKLVERQIELLRKNGIDSTKDCFDATGLASNDCNLTADGQSAPTGYSGAIFTMNISKVPSSSSYSVKASWDTLGSGKANVTMYYLP